MIDAASEQKTTDTLRGSFAWMSPEYLNEGPLQYKHTKETDIWAFGMTVYVSDCFPTYCTTLYVVEALTRTLD